MPDTSQRKCPHTRRNATLYCGSYFVKCSTCNKTLITIPWFSVEPLLEGHLTVLRAKREKVAEGPAEEMVPYIRQILMCHERLVLTGPHAVITESQLGDIKNNALEVQRIYFSKLVDENPGDESLPFALAQVLHELGDEQAANSYYDAGIAFGKRNWFRKLPMFLLPSLGVSFILWKQSFAPWLAIIVALIGPGLWAYIFRNRQQWLPILGFGRRSEIAASVDMGVAISPKKPT